MALVVAVRGAAWADSPEPPAPPEPIEEVLERSRTARKPVVIEFHAAWCGPCRKFERDVLPQVASQMALKSVVFVRYDIDDAYGRELAQRYHAHSVPTFVVLSTNGELVLRRAGAPRSRDEFVALIAEAAALGTPIAVLHERMAAGPGDPAVLLDAARWHKARGEHDEAIELYTRAAAADPDNAAGVRATATLEGAKLAASRQRVVEAAKAAAAFVRAYPGDPQAHHLLQVAVLSGALPAADVDELLALRLGALGPEDDPLYFHVMVAIAAERPDAAMAAAARLLDAWPDWIWAHIAAAEAADFAGDQPRARASYGRCLSLAATDEQRHYCKELGKRLDTRIIEPSPWVEKEVFDARVTLVNLEEPGPDGDARRSQLEQTQYRLRREVELRDNFHRLANERMERAAHPCREHAGRLTAVWVAVEFGATGDRPTRVVVLDPDAPPALRTCVETSILRTGFELVPERYRGAEAARYPYIVTFEPDERLAPDDVEGRRVADAATERSAPRPGPRRPRWSGRWSLAVLSSQPAGWARASRLDVGYRWTRSIAIGAGVAVTEPRGLRLHPVVDVELAWYPRDAEVALVVRPSLVAVDELLRGDDDDAHQPAAAFGVRVDRYWGRSGISLDASILHVPSLNEIIVSFAAGAALRW